MFGHVLDKAHRGAIDHAAHDHPELIALAIGSGDHSDRFHHSITAEIMPRPGRDLILTIECVGEQRSIGAGRPQDRERLLLIGHARDPADGDVVGKLALIGRIVSVEPETIVHGKDLTARALDVEQAGADQFGSDVPTAPVRLTQHLDVRRA